MSTNALLKTSMLALLLGLGTGCDDEYEENEKSSQSELTPTKELHDLCMEWEKIECEANQRCCTTERYRYIDMDACLEQARRDCDDLLELEAIETGKLRIDPAAAPAEFELLSDLAERCVEPGRERESAMIVRTVDVNESCGGERDFTSAQSCKPGLFCQVTEASAETSYAYSGTCQPLRGRGQACQQHPQFDHVNPCAEGLACLGSTRTCEPARQHGEACTDFSDCADGTSCSGEGVCMRWEPSEKGPYCDGTRPNACTATGSSTQPAVGCQAGFHCGEDSFGARCTGSEGAWTCVCDRNSVTLQSFSSPDFCALDNERRARALETACGFDLTY